MKQVVVLTGPTCSGKSTLENHLAARGYGKVISHTTREPRPGEANAVDYYFVDAERFNAQSENFVEKVSFDGNQYGVHCKEIERLEGLGFKKIVIVAEPLGAKQIRDWCAAREIPCNNFFLCMAAELIYARFLDRFLLDTSLNRVSKYAKRMVTMQGEQMWASSGDAYIRLNATLPREDLVKQVLAFGEQQ